MKNPMLPIVRTSIWANDGVELVGDCWNPGAAPTLLLLPAGAETRHVWQPVVDHLGSDARSIWRIVAADHRGHGESGRSENYRFEQFYCDLLKWISELGGRPMVVAGGSIGGALGLVAAGEGAAIDGLVLLDVPVAPVLQRVLVEHSRIQSAAVSGHSSMSTIDPRFIESGFIEDVFRDIDRWRRAARKLKVPTLLIAGGESVVGSRQRQEYRECVPHGEFEQLQAGHLVARDDPRGTADRLRHFLSEHWPT